MDNRFFVKQTAECVCLQSGEYKLYSESLTMNTGAPQGCVLYFRKKSTAVNQVCIREEAVEIVNKYKYLGTCISSDLKWNDNTETQCKKAHEFHVDTSLLILFYKSLQVLLCGIIL